jgi:hypothetical protein
MQQPAFFSNFVPDSPDFFAINTDGNFLPEAVTDKRTVIRMDAKPVLRRDTCLLPFSFTVIRLGSSK